MARNGLADGLSKGAILGGSGTQEKKVLVFTHRPILAGLVATASCITDAEGIQKILDAKELIGKGFRVFNYDISKLTLEV